MVIGIILHPYGEVKPGGLARTIFEWTSALLRNDPNDEYIVFLKSEPINKPNLPGVNWRLHVLGGGVFWLNKLKTAPPADVYLFQTPVLPLFWEPKNSIIIAQDFPYFYLPPHSLKEIFRNFIVKAYHKNSLRRAAKVIAVSKATKNDLMKFFRVSEDKISVIYMGFKNVCATKEIFTSLPEKFFLFVGVIKERKNVLRIVEAFKKFKKENSNQPHKLVFAGRPSGWYAAQIQNFIATHKLKDQTVFLDHINDGQLSYVYKRAESLLFPSIVESFGFPVLEAMACGTPVITSNIGGPAEIGANAALLVDPYSSEQIANGMARIVNDSALRARLVTAGQARAGEFSWDKTVRETLKLINSLYEHKN